ncbi:Soluble aldose sugar dehydrogenase YliI precursor [Agrobacterium sp. DSM 25558]|uniref:Soluble aldose sugar dehydrogenase YliI n=3 Tax=Pseudomonadota TaxID=1224 RepID=A0A1R3TML4_9HYPH|nr:MULTISPECIES: PQQ-dependent sugar dehydrogenase [Agrobacterium]MDX8314063.1 PQQ-dependent sugar dehydrogenase [Agrobacterium rosae]SCX11548.1 Soluble aldose sugar dehydrogenase YliI precursor [Agrobacterium sp. DSM 25558]SCX23464.1 Soluble aldose sugar dehydrogenase YliI precursor [Agrobacterium rosae]
MPRTHHLLTTTILSMCLIAPLAPMANAQSTVPAETKQANAPDQKPAFEGQTRAVQPEKMPSLQKTVVADDLPHLWSMEILPDGRMLVAAKEGAMHIVADGKAGPALEGVPEVASAGQGGLLDIALAPDFDSSKMIYFSFSEPRDGGNGTSVASAKLMESGGKAVLEDTKVIFRQMPTYDGDKHFGSRLAFGPNNELYVTVGERSDKEPRVQAQDLSSGLGKVFRIDKDGKAFEGNPFAAQQKALPEIWSYGHRNVQSSAIDGQGRLWTVEHGPKGGDELNLPKPGLNYGWPVITYGIEYSGGAVGDGMTAKDGMEQPVYYWDPVIGPSGMVYYDSDAIPEWKGSLIIGGLVSQGIVVLKVENDKVVSEGRLPLEARIRDVKVGSDGAVYAVTEERGGGKSQILKLAPDA